MRPWYKYIIRENITEIHVTIKGTLLDRWEGGIFEGEEGIITSILQPKTPRIFNKASLNAFALIRFLRREPEYHPEEIGIAFDYLQPILPEKVGEGVKVFSVPHRSMDTLIGSKWTVCGREIHASKTDSPADLRLHELAVLESKLGELSFPRAYLVRCDPS